MNFKMIRRKINKGYGGGYLNTYDDGDMSRIKHHYDFRKEQGPNEFLIDDVTWHDLSMDEVFSRINLRLTTSGEQYLYYLLRSPALNEAEYERRRELIGSMEKNPQLRSKLEVIFSKLGRSRDAKMHETFVTSNPGKGKLLLYVFLAFALPVFLLMSLVFNSIVCMLLLVGLLFLNPVLHFFHLNRIKPELDTVNYLCAVVVAARKMKKLPLREVEEHLPNLHESMERLKAFNYVGGVPKAGDTNDDLLFVSILMMTNFFLIDLISYEWTRHKLEKNSQAILNIYEIIGVLEASIAITSYRERLKEYSEPLINFNEQEDVTLKITDVAHPLVKNPVVNSVDTNSSVLLTGSNASGKSTFLKSIAINMIMAQSICTVLAKNYSASAFYIYTSMAISDNISEGDSYFIAEIKSIKRIVDVLTAQKPVFCVIDEILRGTNTIERIASANEILKLVAQKGALCFSATHDIELCELLEQDYQMLHFTESIGCGGEVVFDYKLRSGPAMTRNAIKLLDALGFDKRLIQAANTRADLYNTSGKWDAEGVYA